MPRRPSHQPSMPAMQQSLYFPVDISEMPASTRTSFTRVDHDRPGTSGGPPVVPPLPDLNLLDGRFDGHRRIFYDYLRDGARPVTAEGDAPPGEYRMRREVVDDYIVAGDADTEEGVEVHGGQERNWDHHSPVDTPQPGSRLAAEPTSPNRPSQDGANSQNSSQSGSSPELPSQISLTILLVDGKRKVMIFDSRTTVGRVKELVWNTWPNDWQEQPRPAGPAYLRLLHLGRVLVDEDTLDQLSIPRPAFRPDDPNPPVASAVVHLSIRSYVPPVKGSKRRIGLFKALGTGCCCVQ